MGSRSKCPVLSAARLYPKFGGKYRALNDDHSRSPRDQRKADFMVGYEVGYAKGYSAGYKRGKRAHLKDAAVRSKRPKRFWRRALGRDLRRRKASR